MSALAHGFRIDEEKCQGCLACMRVCPTHAIRVRQGRARYTPERCIDCGVCLSSCQWGAIAPTTSSVKDLCGFKFRVAIPSPVLFGQFPAGISPAHISQGLLMLGFDAVWDFAVEISLVDRAIKEYLENWKGPLPLISVACPVVVRLVQVAYPRMVDQLICIQPPREIAGREAKRRYSGELGIPRDQIAAIHITPCQAKTISILEPAERVESNLDGTLGISEVYNAIVASANTMKAEPEKPPKAVPIRSAALLRSCLGDGLSQVLAHHRYLHVTGISNITQVFDDIEKGRLRNVEFVEAHSCWSGCAGGNLTVANVYVTLSKMQSLLDRLPDMDRETLAEVERRYSTEDFGLGRPILPRPARGHSGNLSERVRAVREAEALLTKLPGLDCGLCGAPTCKEMAKDVSIGDALLSECIYHSNDLQRSRESKRIPKEK
ncbi:MAG: 4Fe-4S dicluster domain-containing protein [Candidatus Eisenbacteria bacterium]|nr:4Fe-4S dicluster domain-containing protein [Candidatus Eisenbacteria bacterium]